VRVIRTAGRGTIQVERGSASEPVPTAREPAVKGVAGL
jgi:hypothetical protein